MGLRLYRGLTYATMAGGLSAAACLLAFRHAILPTRPGILATLVVVTLVLAAATLAVAIRRRALTAGLLCGGLVLVLAGGLTNWLLSLQGYVILTELDAVPLTGGTHLQAFDTGSLSNVAEMNLTMQLESFDLLPDASGFVPSSRIRLIEKGSEPHVIDVVTGKTGTLRTLRFHQGAFGFAPRIVITRNGDTLFDRYVPFTTRPHDGRTLSFDGAFNVERERLAVRGAISLEQLDEKMRGHPRLGLTLQHDGKLLGSGELAVGHFAKLDEGYAIGFAGMKKWSEIDISRRNYPEPIYAGALLMLAGIFAWPVMRMRE